MKKMVLCIIMLVFVAWYYDRRAKRKLELGKVPVRPPKVSLRYSKKLKENEYFKITSSQKAVEVLREIWSSKMDIKEEFIVLLLNNSNKVLGYHKLSEGGITGTIADLRLLFSVAVQSLAVSMILAHNHPSGSLKPSRADRYLTERVQESGKMLNIKLLDHIILTKEGYFSFTDEGELIIE